MRSLRGALARRIALSGSYTRRLKEVRAELDELKAKGLGGGIRARELEEEVERLEAHIKAIPFIDGLRSAFQQSHHKSTTIDQGSDVLFDGCLGLYEPNP